MLLALLFHHLMLNMIRMLVHPSSGACVLLWIYFMCCIALVRCVLVLRCGSAGWCGILMQAEALKCFSKICMEQFSSAFKFSSVTEQPDFKIFPRCN
jgi:hypothetical protein